MPIPTKEKFSLSKVKLLKDGGLDVHYEVTEVGGNESYTNKYHVLSAKDIHPDLRHLFNNLRPIMGRVFNITSFKTMMAPFRSLSIKRLSAIRTNPLLSRFPYKIKDPFTLATKFSNGISFFIKLVIF